MEELALVTNKYTAKEIAVTFTGKVLLTYVTSSHLPLWTIMDGKAAKGKFLIRTHSEILSEGSELLVTETAADGT
jgi:hypothetical protein